MSLTTSPPHRRRRGRLLSATVTAALLLSVATVFVAPAPPASADTPLVINADMTAEGERLNERMDTLNAWDRAAYPSDWTTASAQAPDGTMSTQYPFLRYVELMTATGGCYPTYATCATGDIIGNAGSRGNRDLLVDPTNPASAVDASSLVTAAQNILDQGLKPYIKIANVPVSMSQSPYLNVYNLNGQFPSDWSRYYTYVRGIAQQLNTAFGTAELRSWKFGVGTEVDNPDWFDDKVSVTSTRDKYFKLYDYTVAALQSAIGAGNLNVGTHLCDCNGGWEVNDFVDHVTTGTNLYTGGTGTQVNFLSLSGYTSGDPSGYGVPSFPRMTDLRAKVASVGLKGVTFGIDEGRVLNGTDGIGAYARAVGQTYQAAFDASYVKAMADAHIDWYSRWSVNSDTTWPQDAVDTISSNVARLTHLMVDDNYISTRRSGIPASWQQTTDALVGINTKANTAHVMAYVRAGITANTPENPLIRLNNVVATSGSTVTVKTYRLDNDNGQFWGAWQADAAARGIPASHYSWSKDSEDVTTALNNASDIAYFKSRVPYYRTLAAMTSTTSTATVTGNTLTFTPTIPSNGVVFYEITGITSVQSTVTTLDDSAFTYTGSWSTGTGLPTSTWYSGTSRYNGVAGASASYSCASCTGLQWLATQGSDNGVTDVFVDGTYVRSVDNYRPGTRRPSQVVFGTGPLAAGPHTITLVVSGKRSAASSAALTEVDGIRILSTGAPLLTGTVATTTVLTDLSEEGAADWVHWGLSSASTVVRKESVPAQISTYSVVGGGTPVRFTNNPTAFAWANGTPVFNSSGTTTGVYVSGVGKGLRITAPADPATRTLRVYTGVWQGTAKVTATLSDGSASGYQDTSMNSTTAYVNGFYTFTYRAASANQQLTVTITANSSAGAANVDLKAATLR